MTDSQVPPVVCTLTIGKRAERVLEWGDLRDLALSSETVAGGVASTYPIELADKIEDLANRELSCCGSWLQISTAQINDRVRLEVTTTNPDGLEIIRSMSINPAGSDGSGT